MNCCHEERQCADLARLEKQINEHTNEVYRELLKRDKKIADLACKFNGDIQKAIYEYLLLMEKEGKLNEIINDTLLNDLLVLEHKTNGVINIKEFGAIGDGFCDDTKAIQKAIDHAHEIGGATVVIPASSGSFIFTAITVKEGVTLKGMGGVLKVKNSRCTDPEGTYYLIRNEGDNVSIVDLIIDGNKEHNTAYKVADAITVMGKNIRVTGCTIMNPPDSGIMYSCVENSLCTGNIIIGAPDCGIYINNNDKTDLMMGSRCDGNIIEGCYTGIAMKRIVHHMSVCGNVIKNCDYGITHENASSDTDYSTDTIVNDNIIEGTTYTAIILRGSNNCTVNGNYINGFKFAGIQLQGCKECAVVGNTIKGAIVTTDRKGAAISLVARGNLSCKYNVITANVLEVNFFDEVYYFSFIEVTGSTNVTSDHNIVTGNTCNGKVTRGMSITTANNNQIANNIFNGATDSILISGTKGNVLQNNVSDGSPQRIYDVPVIAVTPNGTKIYCNNLTTAPTFTANDHDICIAKTPYSSHCTGWTYYGGKWHPLNQL